MDGRRDRALLHVRDHKAIKSPSSLLILNSSAPLLLKRGANISRRNFLNIGLSRPQDPERARRVLDSRSEKGFDFADVVGGAVDYRVADRQLISELIDKSHKTPSAVGLLLTMARACGLLHSR